MVKFKRPHFLIIALFIQLIALLVIASLVRTQSIIDLSLFEWSLAQALLACVFAYCLRMPAWWLPIHLLFMPMIITTLAIDVSPLWFLFFFICLTLVYGKTYKTRVPLYLSSQQVNTVLESWLPKREHFSFVDLGSGCGGLITRLAKAHKNGLFHGIEAAPLPCLISKLRNSFSTSPVKFLGEISGSRISRNMMSSMLIYLQYPWKHCGKKQIRKCVRAACSSATLLKFQALIPMNAYH